MRISSMEYGQLDTAALARQSATARTDSDTAPVPAVERSGGTLRDTPRSARSSQLNATVQSRLNLEVSDTQQVLQYLDRLREKLQSLRLAIVGRMSGNGDARSVDNRLAQVESQWQQRYNLTGGRLDNRLGLHEEGEAPRSFYIRGFDSNAPSTSGAETLTFIGASPGARPVSVSLRPEMSSREIANSLNSALAPNGINVKRDDAGRVTFSVPEQKFSALTDNLMIRGGGVRFPAGQPVRAQVRPAPGAIEPSAWQNNDAALLHATLQKVTHAFKIVDASYSAARSKLNHATDEITREAAHMDMLWADEASQDVKEKIASSWEFQNVAAVAAVVMAVDSSRVRAILRQ